eukprot:3380966-Rhodomonas_salina.1
MRVLGFDFAAVRPDCGLRFDSDMLSRSITIWNDLTLLMLRALRTTAPWIATTAVVLLSASLRLAQSNLFVCSSTATCRRTIRSGSGLRLQQFAFRDTRMLGGQTGVVLVSDLWGYLRSDPDVMTELSVPIR